MLSDRLVRGETLPTEFVFALEALRVLGSVRYELNSGLTDIQVL